jgi:hypothetical protein
LNTLADQARQDGNDEGAKQAKHLSLALVAVMLIGVIMAGIDQIVKLDGQIGTVIDTLLLIARAVRIPSAAQKMGAGAQLRLDHATALALPRS